MDDFIRFLGVMSALSASAQTMTHQVRKRFNWLRLDGEASANGKSDKDGKEGKDEKEHHLIEIKKGKVHANVHLACGVNGFLLAAAANIHPLQYLKITPLWAYAKSPIIANGMDYVVAGVLVAYGGPWFHEVLGIMREYKKNLRGKV